MTLKLNENLRRIMKERGLNQVQLSKISGVAKSTINGYLNTTKNKTIKLDIAQIKKIADVLKTDFHQLLFGQTDPHSEASVPNEVLHEIFRGDVRIVLHRIEKSEKK